MKLVKHTTFGDINTSIDGVLYQITEAGIQVADEVATKMQEQFLHTVEVTDVVAPDAPVVVPVEPSTPQA
jgi:hypothetical protein